MIGNQDIGYNKKGLVMNKGYILPGPAGLLLAPYMQPGCARRSRRNATFIHSGPRVDPYASNNARALADNYISCFLIKWPRPGVVDPGAAAVIRYLQPAAV
jgi:hypothetical protein